MKTNKMTKTIIGLLAGLMLLSMSATAQAVWSDDLLANGDFTGAAIIPNASGPLTSGQWYGSGTGWDLIADFGNTGAYAKLTEENSVQHLIQAVQLSPPNSATPGPVQVSFDYVALGLTPGQATVKLYGSNSPPQYNNGTLFAGDQLGMISDIFLRNQTEWASISPYIWDALLGYTWYTIDIYAKTQYHSTNDNYFGVDNVSVVVSSVPVPSAVWLLGSGLIGMLAVRRRFSK